MARQEEVAIGHLVDQLIRQRLDSLDKPRAVVDVERCERVLSQTLRGDEVLSVIQGQLFSRRQRGRKLASRRSTSGRPCSM